MKQPRRSVSNEPWLWSDHEATSRGAAEEASLHARLEAAQRASSALDSHLDSHRDSLRDSSLHPGVGGELAPRAKAMAFVNEESRMAGPAAARAYPIRSATAASTAGSHQQQQLGP